MVVKMKMKHGKSEEVGVAYRKRLWVYSELCRENRLPGNLDVGSLRALDEHLFSNPGAPSIAESANLLMDLYDCSSSGDKRSVRESVSNDFMTWAPKSCRRFEAWLIPTCKQIIGGDFPLKNNNYISWRNKVILWFDTMHGSRRYKSDIEINIRGLWYENIKIDKLLPILAESNIEKITYFWEKTKEKFFNTSADKTAAYYWPGYDKPTDFSQLYYNSVLLFDLSGLNSSAKKDMIRAILRGWANNKRKKKQVNLSLTSDAAEKLSDLAANRGLSKAGLIEGLIYSEYEKLL